MQILPFYHLFHKPGWQPNEYKSIDASTQRSHTGSLKTPHHSTENEIVPKWSIEYLVIAGNWFYMWAILYGKELCMTRLLYGSCTTFKALPRKLLLAILVVHNWEL